jgi:carboxyl-terminal processing protease
MKRNSSIMKKTILVLSLVSVGAFFGILLNTAISGDNLFEQMKKFQYVYNMAYRNYVIEKTPEELSEAAIKGLLGSLDVHSVYIDKKGMEKVTENFSGEYEGIGIEFDIVEDTIIVVSPISGGPSEELGILAGDKIVKIEGDDAIGLTRQKVPELLKGPKGTKVSVDIFRDGDKQLHHFDIIRDKIPIETVDASYMIGDDIGYISVNRFAATTHDEMMKAARKLKAEGMKKLILDLRYNPGGYLQQAFFVADEFLKGGDTIVYTKGRRPEFDDMYQSTDNGELEDIPLIVMINEGSASASEIVSGSMQDLDRGLIVGETSYGKGLVQRQYDIGDGSAFRLTIAYYYTASGRSIQRPFQNQEEYRKMVGRLELNEGNNLQHNLEELMKEKKINMDSIPIFHTRKGRKVLGGGGITPDYIVKQDTSRLTESVAKMRAKRIFYDYVYEFLRTSAGASFKAKYENNFKDFNKNYNITDDMIERVVEIAKAKEIDVKDEDVKKDKEFLKVTIKATLAKIIWDRNHQIQITSVLDRQLKKAVTLFDEAIQLSNMK